MVCEYAFALLIEKEEAEKRERSEKRVLSERKKEREEKGRKKREIERKIGEKSTRNIWINGQMTTEA